MTDDLATPEELAALEALTLQHGVEREFYRFGRRTGPLTSQEVRGQTIRIMAGLAPKASTPPAPPATPRPTTAEGAPMSDSQRAFLRRLAHQITGDGDAFVDAFLSRHGGAPTSQDASAALKNLQGRREAGESAPKTKGTRLTTAAPSGRYAVTLPGTTNPLLVQINRPKTGRWAGYTFVVEVSFLPGGEQRPVLGREAELALEAISADPRGCSARYGTLTGHCGLCNLRLRNEASKALGIGPECITRF